MKRLRRYLVAGLLIWAPLAVTFLLLRFAVNVMDKTLAIIPQQYRPDELLGFHIPGLGVTEVKRMAQIAERKETIDGLLGPLNKSQKDIMSDLLESVQTNRLQSAFDKYLPSVIDGNSPAKQKAVITEGTEVTGNKNTITTNASSQADDNVVDIRRLAGL